jgi:hypothetical protein
LRPFRPAKKNNLGKFAYLKTLNQSKQTPKHLKYGTFKLCQIKGNPTKANKYCHGNRWQLYIAMPMVGKRGCATLRELELARQIFRDSVLMISVSSKYFFFAIPFHSKNIPDRNPPYPLA